MWWEASARCCSRRSSTRMLEALILSALTTPPRQAPGVGVVEPGHCSISSTSAADGVMTVQPTMHMPVP